MISTIKPLFTACMLGSALIAAAVPAKREPFKITQPDGTELTVRLVGDERSHCYFSEDGYPLAFDNGTFFYGIPSPVDGMVVSSGIKAMPVGERSPEALRFLENTDKETMLRSLERRDNQLKSTRFKAAAGPGLFAGTSFPAIGDQKALVILVEYSDIKFRLDNPHDYFNRLLNQEGFSDYGGTGSAADFFKENSNGQFRPQFDVYGPVTLSRKMSYYGSNNYYDEDSHPEEMAIEACRALDPDVDFSEYDRDGDGLIDNVFVFYAGLGEASGGSADTVWPHSADIMDWDSTPYVFDGVRLNRYACTNEWGGKRPDGVGTFIHEFSHVLGLPDLYATSYTTAFTPGPWSTLDYGPYNNDGCTPPLYSAFERYALGWMEPTVIDGPCEISLKQISANEACIIKTPKDNEYFLLENRQKTGWDTYLPGHGMLVWHIDYNASVWAGNKVNNSASHQYVDIEEADDLRSEFSYDGDPFPGSANVRSFTDNTQPSMKTWNGTRLNLPLTEITETADSLITFKVAGGTPPPPAVVALDATDVTPRSFTARWNQADAADSYRLSVYCGQETVGNFDRLDVGNVTSYPISGLEPGTEYSYTVMAVNPHGTGNKSNEITVTTLPLSFEYMIPVALDATVGNDYVEAAWKPAEGADAYLLDMYTKLRKGYDTDCCDFTGGIAGMPKGWSTDAKMTYAGASYSGNAAPALRLNDNYIETPLYDDDIHSLSFWYRGSAVPEENRLEISICTITDGWSLFSSIPVSTETGGTTVNIDELPVGTRAARIAHYRPASGAVAIDDIVVEWGGAFDAVPVGDITSLNVGNVTSYRATGLTAGTPYYYRVTALKGDIRSLPSREVTAIPGVSNSVDNVTGDNRLAVSCNGLTLTLSQSVPAVVTVTDIAGRLIASTETTEAAVNLPAPGIYIVATAGQFRKIIAR